MHQPSTNRARSAARRPVFFHVAVYTAVPRGRPAVALEGSLRYLRIGIAIGIANAMDVLWFDAFNASRLFHFLSYNTMKDSRPLSTIRREQVAFRYSSGEVVMPSHSPREGGWLALCLVTCVRRAHVCLSMSIYVLPLYPFSSTYAFVCQSLSRVP